MIGDRLNTDIEFGKNGGLSTLLVLTGAIARRVSLTDFDTVTSSFRCHQGGRDQRAKPVANRPGLRDQVDWRLLRPYLTILANQLE